MLRAMKHQLQEMADDPQDGFRLRVEHRVGRLKAAEVEAALKSLILTMPDCVLDVRRWMDEPDLSPGLKRLHGFLMTYLYLPLDLLPEPDHGLFGYLDDAYIVGSVYVRTCSQAQFPKASQQELSLRVQEWLNAARSVIPGEALRMDAMLDAVNEGRLEPYYALADIEESTQHARQRLNEAAAGKGGPTHD